MHANANYLICIIIIYIFSCHNREKKYERQSFFLEKKDSIIIRENRNLQILYYDTINKNLIVFDKDKFSVLKISNSGVIKDSFSFADRLEIGSTDSIDQIGYAETSLIVVGCTKGYFTYNLKGKLIKQNIQPARYNGRMYPNLFETILINGDRLLITNRRSLIASQFSERNDPQYYNLFRTATIFNTNTGKTSDCIPFEKESIFKKFDYYYANKFSIIDVDRQNNLIYTLHNPESVINIYKIFPETTCILQKTINLVPDYFEIREKPKFKGVSTTPEIIRIALINSHYTALFAKGTYVITCYSSGVDADEYDNMKSATEYNTIYKRYNKNYLQIFKDGKKLGGDIELPKEIYTIDHFISENYILAKKVSPFAEKSVSETIYLYQFKKI